MNNTFFVAKIKLASLYTLIFGGLVIFISIFLYHIFAADIHEDMVSVYQDNPIDIQIINQHKLPLRDQIIKMDIIILIFIAFSSFFLAGLTLGPIQANDLATKQFIANASHELRTPLAILKSDIEVFQSSGSLPPAVSTAFKMYLDEIDRMSFIIDNMLTIFRFDSHKISLNQQKFNFSLLVSHCLTHLSPYAYLKKVRFEHSTPPKIYVNGDQFLLELAIRNVVKNAIEYSQPNSPISVKLSKINSDIFLSIQDHGIGIPSPQLKNIFNRFQRSKMSLNKRKEGVGLGLSLVKQVIDLHHGEIIITSQESIGTTVNIKLPSIS